VYPVAESYQDGGSRQSRRFLAGAPTERAARGAWRFARRPRSSARRRLRSRRSWPPPTLGTGRSRWISATPGRHRRA